MARLRQFEKARGLRPIDAPDRERSREDDDTKEPEKDDKKASQP